MITRIKIENYKSVPELDLDLGRFNVLIGENGCGKSNILEAIALAAAAASNKLDNEFLVSRGIRVTEPFWMRSAFEPTDAQVGIQVSVEAEDGSSKKFDLRNDNQPYSHWFEASSGLAVEVTPGSILASMDAADLARQLSALVVALTNAAPQPPPGPPPTHEYVKLRINVNEGGIGLNDLQWVTVPLSQGEKEIRDFVVYAPENTALRTFEAEGQIEPLGIRGEGLFKLLSVFGQDPARPSFKELNAQLRLLDWFEDLSLPQDRFEGERRLAIRDRFLGDEMPIFDQRSANEGFLFLLFYFALFITDLTPPFFAIDNIDTSLNPKLCSQLIKNLVQLSKEHNKQVIVTTHSPAILDGLDLKDEDQRLLVVRRNKLGHTKVNRVQPPQVLPGQDPIRLSEAFLRGYLGGLPGNF